MQDFPRTWEEACSLPVGTQVTNTRAFHTTGTASPAGRWFRVTQSEPHFDGGYFFEIATTDSAGRLSDPRHSWHFLPADMGAHCPLDWNYKGETRPAFPPPAKLDIVEVALRAWQCEPHDTPRMTVTIGTGERFHGYMHAATTSEILVLTPDQNPEALVLRSAIIAVLPS